MVTSKTCLSCTAEKPFSGFYKNSVAVDGLRTTCKDCFNLVRKRHYQKNKQQVAAYGKAYRLRNLEQIAIGQLSYRLRNPEKVRQSIELRRARVKSASIYGVTVKDIKRIMKKPCTYCGKQSEHLDHVIPLSRGGLHGVGNLTASCAYCNRQKGNKFITEWKKVRGW